MKVNLKVDTQGKGFPEEGMAVAGLIATKEKRLLSRRSQQGIGAQTGANVCGRKRDKCTEMRGRYSLAPGPSGAYEKKCSTV